jgi:succinyl-diaminopimelate desuccinylase
MSHAAIDPVDLAARLIRCPSVTPTDAGALDVLTEELEALEFTCHRLPFGDGADRVDNLFARRGDGAPHFCFAGHTDVVPVGDEAAWSAGPFSGDVRDGHLWGRGAADMKGAIACFIAAVARVLAEKAPAGSISLLITGDEEGPAVNGTDRVLEWMAAHGHVPDACLVGEPTNPERLGESIKIGRRGSLTGHLSVRGTQGHVAYPKLADNPVPRLLEMLRALAHEPLDAGSKNFEPSNLEITTVDIGNPAANVIPGAAHAVFNIRFNDLHTSETLSQWIRKELDGVEGAYDLCIKVSGESFLTPLGPFTEVLARSVESVLGAAPAYSTAGGTSDARFIHKVCPVAEFGLVGQTMHKVDERTAIADLERLTGIYVAVLLGMLAP